MTLDWSRFERGSVGPERAFEAFCAQLFERWIRREYGDHVELYVLHGAGGDGGVEAFATLADGVVVGLQAKWFPGNLTDGRVEQIRSSVNTARTMYPTLQRYVVALPSNRRDSQAHHQERLSHRPTPGRRRPIASRARPTRCSSSTTMSSRRRS